MDWHTINSQSDIVFSFRIAAFSCGGEVSDLLSKRKSFVFLSLLCFSLADVRDGLGPFLGVYLQGEGWRPDEIGFTMTAGGLLALYAPRRWEHLRIILGTSAHFWLSVYYL